MRVLISLLLGLSFIACEQKGSLESTKERAQAEQEAGKDVDNRSQQEKAVKMEAELKTRHEFYSALAGQLEGEVLVDNEVYKIKFVLSKSLAPYTGDRIRQLSEIESDLINLYLNVQIVQWHPADAATAVGCRIGNIRPDADRGFFTVTANDCPNSYSVYLADEGVRTLNDKEIKAEKVARAIKSKEQTLVKSFVGTIQPSSNARNYTFIVHRIP